MIAPRPFARAARTLPLLALILAAAACSDDDPDPEPSSGYALQAWFPTRTFTAIAAFEDEAAMRRFTSSSGHSVAAAGMTPHIGPGSKFVTFDCYGADLPPRADDLARRLEAIPGLGEIGGPPGHPIGAGGSHHSA